MESGQNVPAVATLRNPAGVLSDATLAALIIGWILLLLQLFVVVAMVWDKGYLEDSRLSRIASGHYDLSDLAYAAVIASANNFVGILGVLAGGTVCFWTGHYRRCWEMIFFAFLLVAITFLVFTSVA
jgi:hypothetical protein